MTVATRTSEYLCLKIDELKGVAHGRVEDVIQRCWERYANSICYHLPFVSHRGLPELIETLAKLNVVSATVKTLDNKHVVVDIQGDVVCIGMGP